MRKLDAIDQVLINLGRLLQKFWVGFPNWLFWRLWVRFLSYAVWPLFICIFSLQGCKFVVRTDHGMSLKKDASVGVFGDGGSIIRR